MKKYLPFVFPGLALLIVLFLAFRWYNMQANQKGEVTPFAEGVQIEELSSEEQGVMGTVADLQTVELVKPDEEAIEQPESQYNQASGQVRYEIVDEKIRLSVSTSLPKLSTGVYQVWFKEIDGKASRRAFTLNFAKGGYMGNAAISTQVLPFEVVVSYEELDDNQMEQVILSGKIVSPEEL